MPRNNNRGAAGRRGTPATSVATFFEYYIYEGPARGNQQSKYLQGKPLDPSFQRQLRRWRNGETIALSPRSLNTVLRLYGFGVAWFEKWCAQQGHPTYVRVVN